MATGPLRSAKVSEETLATHRGDGASKFAQSPPQGIAVIYVCTSSIPICFTFGDRLCGL